MRAILNSGTLLLVTIHLGGESAVRAALNAPAGVRSCVEARHTVTLGDFEKQAGMSDAGSLRFRAKLAEQGDCRILFFHGGGSVYCVEVA